ncbi:MAG: hypothetical protein JWN73_1409 [Betaproteobacteria bacterium]|nr:hypothetical protein [Betaproteobacteria bacterium]
MRRRTVPGRCAGALLCSALLAGCVTPGSKLVENGRSTLQHADATVISAWPAIAFAPPALGVRQELLLDDKSQVLDDGKTRRYVRGYVLPDIGKPYSITLTSFRQGTPADPAILYPQLVFLDAERRPLAVQAPVRFDYRSGGREGPDGLHAVVFINSADHGERYVVVTSRSLDDAELARSAPNTFSTMPVSVPVRGFVLTWMIPQGHSQAPTRMIAAPGGRLAISFDEYRLRKVGDKD